MIKRPVWGPWDGNFSSITGSRLSPTSRHLHLTKTNTRRGYHSLQYVKFPISSRKTTNTTTTTTTTTSTTTYYVEFSNHPSARKAGLPPRLYPIEFGRPENHVEHALLSYRRRRSRRTSTNAEPCDKKIGCAEDHASTRATFATHRGNIFSTSRSTE